MKFSAAFLASLTCADPVQHLDFWRECDTFALQIQNEVHVVANNLEFQFLVDGFVVPHAVGFQVPLHAIVATIHYEKQKVKMPDPHILVFRIFAKN